MSDDPPGVIGSSGLVERLVARLVERRESLAVAESLTGGLVCATLVAVPGVSRVLRGAVVAYATELKHVLLDVDADLLRREGAVHPEVALQMARGAVARLGADWGLATTGVAGPDPLDGQAAGTVFVAVHGPTGERVSRLTLEGDQAAVRVGSVREVLTLLSTCLDDDPRA